MTALPSVSSIDRECAQYGAHAPSLLSIAQRRSYAWGDVPEETVEVPAPSELTDDRWVWRPGFGWVERPVEAPVWPALQRGAAA